MAWNLTCRKCGVRLYLGMWRRIVRPELNQHNFIGKQEGLFANKVVFRDGIL